MESLSFGLVVAYLLPGFIVLAGLVPIVPAIGLWLAPNHGDAGLGPPIYALLSATTIGMILSCFRWIIVDSFLEWTGVPKPVRRFEKLTENLEAHKRLLEVHYQYYQFYANTLVAIVLAYLLNRFMETLPLLGIGTDLGVLILCAGLLAGSRDTLSKYRNKLSRVFGTAAEKDSMGEIMTNGDDHHEGTASKPASGSKARSKAAPAAKSGAAKGKEGKQSK